LNLKAVLFLVLMVGATVGAIYLYRMEHPESTPEEEQELLPPDLGIFGSVYWGSRDTLAIIGKSGEVYEILRLGLSYKISGSSSEFNWDTLNVDTNVTVAIEINGKKGAKTIFNKEFTSKEGDISGEYNVTDILLDVFTTSEIADFINGSVVNLYVYVTVTASVRDVYDIQRTKQATKAFTDTAVWVVPDFGMDITLKTPYQIGYDEGKNEGWTAGWNDAKNGLEKKYTTYSDQQGETYDEGYEEGYRDGYIDGYDAYIAFEHTGGDGIGIGCFLGLEDIKVQEAPFYMILLLFAPFLAVVIIYVYLRRRRR